MKYVEQDGDVRATSANAAYMGVVFQGTIDDAIAQAKAAPDHGIPELNGRAELLAFLRVKLAPRGPSVEMDENPRYGDEPAEPVQPWDKFSPYSLEYAMARWPSNFKL